MLRDLRYFVMLVQLVKNTFTHKFRTWYFEL
jgi:hypothetical protein